jgi:hypothetical protein
MMNDKTKTAEVLSPVAQSALRNRDNSHDAFPEHLTDLPGTRWRLWRWAALRGAGFPASKVLMFSDEDGAASADEVLQAEEEVEASRKAALELVDANIAALKRDSGWEDISKRNSLLPVARSLRQGKVPQPLADSPSINEAIAAFASARKLVESLASRFRETYKAATVRLSKAIREVASSEHFREALVWQNRNVLHGGIAALMRSEPTATSAKLRKQEELIASYWQRYCTKNDTIGFFGPVGWARLNSTGEAISVTPGPDLLATRNVYFEAWAINALCQLLAGNKSLLPWVPPRRFPFVYLEGTILHLPLRKPFAIPTAQAAVLASCDGSRPAKEIARKLARALPTIIKSEDEVYKILGLLRGMGLISWVLEISEDFVTERPLRRLLERIDDEALRASSLQILNEMEGALKVVADSAGDADRLDRAMYDLETTFTRLTGAATTRSAGKMYAGRTLVYEDCRRDIDVQVGPAVLEALSGPLSLMLTSARWFSFEIAAAYRKAFRNVYDQMAQKDQTQEVNMARFWSRVEPLLFGEDRSLIDEVFKVFQKKWLDILSIDPKERRVCYSSEKLQPRVLEAFDAPRPGWKYARYHSPDIMIAASSIEAIRRGEFELVMGELHIAANTLDAVFFLLQHPSPQDLFRAIKSDLPEPRLVPVIPLNWERPKRVRNVLHLSKDFYLEFGVGAPVLPNLKTFASSALTLEPDGDGLVVKSRDSKLRFDIIEFFSGTLSALIVNSFKSFSTGTHTPRVSIDRLIVTRETWRFDASSMKFAYEKEDASRFLEARRWARIHSIPRFVYAKSPVEVKPLYVDFCSPVYVNLFSRIIRQTAEASLQNSVIAISEMIPALEQTWLPDSEGQRYTSELRIVTVDSVT